MAYNNQCCTLKTPFKNNYLKRKQILITCGIWGERTCQTKGRVIRYEKGGFLTIFEVYATEQHRTALAIMLESRVSNPIYCRCRLSIAKGYIQNIF